MARFRVTLVADARVSGVVENIEASTQTEADAIALAHAKEGNVVWHYEGVTDGTIELGE
jgi:hypothetical protein